jgi:hypothetical protein
MRINLHVRYDKNKRPMLDGEHWAPAVQCSDSLRATSLPQFGANSKPRGLLLSDFIPLVPWWFRFANLPSLRYNPAR